jgi:glycosyltransferase involved in cell wall biosynthesis
MSYKLSILIPVYNERNTINRVIDNILRVSDLNDESMQYVIVDDGSNDGTDAILKKNPYQNDPRFVFIFQKENQGKGSAIREGLKKATGEYTIIQDADLEYDPHDIVRLLKKAEKENLRVVYGSRYLKKTNRKGKAAFYFGGRFVTLLANLLYAQKLTDEPTCYKLFRTDFLKSFPLTCRRFEFCPEVTALISKQNIEISEIPISYFPRSKKEGKKINWRDGLEAIWTLVRLRF